MNARFEKVVFGEACFLVFERVEPEFPMYWHYHPEFQLTLMVDSQGQRLVGDGVSDYRPGDLVLIGPNLPHTWRSGSSGYTKERCHHAVDMQFRADFLGERFLSLSEMRPIFGLLGRSASGLAFGHTRTGRALAQKIADFPSLSPSRRVSSILDILLDLAMEPDARVLSTAHTHPVCRVEDQKRIEAICSYLRDNFDQEINFAMVARKVNMDQASLCRFFKRSTGTTMTEYVTALRVGAAAKMLTETDLSVLEIGFNAGFGNYSNFNRQFKRLKGCAPRNLRREFVSKCEEASPGVTEDPESDWTKKTAQFRGRIS